MPALLFLLLLVAGPAFANPVTYVCEYLEGGAKPSQWSFVWDAKAGLFDGHRFGDVWQDGASRVTLRKTDTSIIEEIDKPGKDSRPVKSTVSMDDYGYFLKTEDGKVIAKGDCKRVPDQNLR